MNWFWLVSFVLCRCHLAVSVQIDLTTHQDDLVVEIGAMRNTMKVLSDQWEKWNTLFITSLEPRITSTASTLSSIDSNVHNLQERAHVWDTFQLHVVAWNDQLASMDRKIDILNKAIEQITVIDNKMNTILSEDYKLDKLIKLTNSVMETVINIENGVKSKQYCKSTKDTLFEEFAARGILSSLKLVERKVDQLLSTRQSDATKTANEDPVVKCSMPKSMETLIKDIASKVDIIFDSVSKANEIDYSDEYLDVKDVEGSGASTDHIQKLPHHKQTNHLPQTNGICKSNQSIKDVSDKISNIDINVLSLLRYNQQRSLAESSSNTISTKDLRNILNKFSNTISINQTQYLNRILNSYFHEDRTHWTSIFNSLSKKCLSKQTFPSSTVRSKPAVESTTPFSDIVSLTENVYTTSNYQYVSKTEHSLNGIVTQQPKTVNKSSCSDLDHDSPSGIYIFKSRFGDFVNERFFDKQFCEMRSSGLWIVIQRRDNYSLQQDFNVSWYDYKVGFGDLQKDFWIGNNFLSRLSKKNNLTLRIELEDFDGNNVWAEYKIFKIADESQKFQLTVGGYSGNSSDAFSSHSGSFFSTYDKKNDDAPECCPCSVSYGGGWWFNRCFESNLNGIYYKKPFENDYFRGIIWEHWLGNYSLKKSLMLVKSTGSTEFYSNSDVVEDP